MYLWGNFVYHNLDLHQFNQLDFHKHFRIKSSRVYQTQQVKQSVPKRVLAHSALLDQHFFSTSMVVVDRRKLMIWPPDPASHIQEDTSGRNQQNCE